MCSYCPAALTCRICAQARTTKSKSRKQAADAQHSSLGNGSGAGRGGLQFAHPVTKLRRVSTCIVKRILPCNAAGQSAKEVPVQKTVPVIGTPADADPDQHEVLQELFLSTTASSQSCLLSIAHEQKATHWRSRLSTCIGIRTVAVCCVRAQSQGLILLNMLICMAFVASYQTTRHGWGLTATFVWSVNDLRDQVQSSVSFCAWSACQASLSHSSAGQVF